MTPVGDAFQVPQYKLRMREGNQSAQDVCVPLQTLPTVSVAPTLTSRLPSAVLRPCAPRPAVTCWSGASPNAAASQLGPRRRRFRLDVRRGTRIADVPHGGQLGRPLGEGHGRNRGARHHVPREFHLRRSAFVRFLVVINGCLSLIRIILISCEEEFDASVRKNQHACKRKLVLMLY